MTRCETLGLAALLAVAAAACGGEAADQQGEQTGDAERPATALTTPSWMRVNHDARTVTMDIVAGQTQANNRWNFNGHANGDATVVVPEGYRVTINFRNDDPANPHSVGIDRRTGSSWPATFESLDEIAFEGAVTEGANSMTDSTQPGESETITFTAGQAGDYTMICYVPAHAVTGMWIGFRVSADGQAGLSTS